ncbi:hypothetical protein OROGR_027485 [Orobanche gracilis]
MERFYSKASPVVDALSSSVVELTLVQSQRILETPKEVSMKIDLENLPSDPGLRPDIMSYSPNLIEQGC